jgi:F-type H+-transporting ATPase subunit delta
MEAATLARPYAKAIFSLAWQEQKLADWSALMKGLADAVRDPEVARWIGHPAIGRGQLAEVLIKAYGVTLSQPAQNLLKLLADNNRLKLAPAIAEQFEQLKADAEKRVEIEITSAAPMDGPQKELLMGAIRKRIERDLDVEWKTDPSLIAGAVVRAGDLVIDGSMAGELAKLRTALTT